MNNKIIIRKNNKTILSMNIKMAKKSAIGELDIMLDSAKQTPFSRVVAGNHFLVFENTVHAISWHGYYQISKENTVQMPTVHFKYDINKKRVYKDVKHIGTININEPFAFPICSLYVPSEEGWLEGLNISSYPSDHTKINYVFKDITSNNNQRIDIFITPKNVSAHQIVEGSLGFAYKFADVPLYNTVDGRLIPLKEIQNNPNIDQNSLIEIFSLGNGHDLIIRVVGDQNSEFSELEGSYSLLVHDPNDSLNRLANRFYAEVEGDQIVRYGVIKEELQGKLNRGSH